MGAGAPRSGEFVSPFDLDQARQEEAPRALVTIRGSRGDAAVVWELGDGEWGVEARPRLGGTRDAALSHAIGLGGPGQSSSLRELAANEQRPGVRAWLLLEAARDVELDEAEALWQTAVEAAAGDILAMSLVHEAHGYALENASRLDDAVAMFTQARSGLPEISLASARLLSRVGLLSHRRGDFEAAEARYQRALEIRQQLAPGQPRSSRRLQQPRWAGL